VLLDVVDSSTFCNLCHKVHAAENTVYEVLAMLKYPAPSAIRAGTGICPLEISRFNGPDTDNYGNYPHPIPTL